MQRISHFRRALVASLAILQMAAPAVVAVVDAELALRAGGAPQVHVEDHTRRACRPAHPDDCALCQLLSHLSAPRADSPTIPWTQVSRSGVCRDAAPLSTFIARAHERTRAPPVG